MSSVKIRQATQADQGRIKEIIHEAGINRNGLAWQRFLVAESEELVVGTGQIKPHSDGCRELASIAVIPIYQHHGIASQLIRALLEDEKGPLYLICARHNETFYLQFNFRAITKDQMPRHFRRIYQAARFIKPVAHLFRSDFDIVIMHREAP